MGKKHIDTNSILEFIKSSKEPVSKKQIIDATGYSGDYMYAMKMLQKEHEELQVTTSKGKSFYSWNEKKALYSEMKNSEGYPDGTAGKAIANVMKCSGRYPMRQQFGEVWSTSNVSDDMEGLLVISAKEGVCICYNVYPQKKGFMKDQYVFKWHDNSGVHYICTLNPVNTQERKLGKKLYEIGTAEKNLLKEFVTAAIDVSPVVETVKTEPVERIVPDPEDKRTIEELETRIDDLKARLDMTAVRSFELEEENNKLKASIAVPEAVTKVEYRTDPKEIEMAVLRAKCEIYEKLLFPSSASNDIPHLVGRMA